MQLVRTTGKSFIDCFTVRTGMCIMVVTLLLLIRLRYTYAALQPQLLPQHREQKASASWLNDFVKTEDKFLWFLSYGKL